jgi:hypothetical protein
VRRGSVPWWAYATHLTCTLIRRSSHPFALSAVHGSVSSRRRTAWPQVAGAGRLWGDKARSAPERVLDRLGAPRRHAYTPPRVRGTRRRVRGGLMHSPSEHAMPGKSAPLEALRALLLSLWFVLEGFLFRPSSGVCPRSTPANVPLISRFEESPCDAAARGAARGAAGAGEGPVGRRRRPSARRACRRGWYASRFYLRACGRRDCWTERCATSRPRRSRCRCAWTAQGGLPREGADSVPRVCRARPPLRPVNYHAPVC